MRNCRPILAAAALLALAACQKQTRIEGFLADAPEAEVVVKLLDINKYQTLDTLKTAADGAFVYKPAVEKGKPEFLYLFYKDTKIASLLLEQGDRVKVFADTLGRYTVEGSEESLKLRQVEKDYTDFLVRMATLREQYAAVDGTPAAREVNSEISRTYIDYYRKAVSFLSQNMKSLTAVPVLFQQVDTDFPVFSQTTDAIHFRNALDSLTTVYPDSRYVKALEKETERRERILSLNNQLSMATEADYPDIKSKDVNGNEVSLYALDSKAVILFFWTATDPESKIINQETYKPVYKDYHDKGLEIFAVSLDTDKAAWASVVRSQELPWVNVNDGLGSASPVVTLYNITSLPKAFLILDGQIVDRRIEGEKALRRELDKVLK